MVKIEINGGMQSFDVPYDAPLLWVIREEAKLLGTKFGCGKGLCGACTVHLNGSAVRSCSLPVSAAIDGKVVTIEGLSSNGNHPLQKAWRAQNVPQCGYCQSGQIMAAASMLKSTPHPTNQEIDSFMSGNICRCGTYNKIRAAIKEAAPELAIKK